MQVQTGAFWAGWSLVFSILLNISLQISSLSSFMELNTELRLFYQENGSVQPHERFQAFSRIMCGHPEVGNEKVPSFNWYEDHDIKSFLGEDGTKENDFDDDNNTSKKSSY